MGRPKKYKSEFISTTRNYRLPTNLIPLFEDLIQYIDKGNTEPFEIKSYIDQIKSAGIQSINNKTKLDKGDIVGNFFDDGTFFLEGYIINEDLIFHPRQGKTLLDSEITADKLTYRQVLKHPEHNYSVIRPHATEYIKYYNMMLKSAKFRKFLEL